VFILLQQSYIVFIFICYHPVARKVAAIRIVAFAESRAWKVVLLARCIATIFDQFQDDNWSWIVETRDWDILLPGRHPSIFL